MENGLTRGKWVKRTTKQREVILSVLRNTKTHPQATDIYSEVRKQLPRVSLGTVYRTLNVLRDAGLIQELARCGDSSRFDGNSQDHYHVTCVECGRVADVEMGGPLELKKGVASDFEILEYRIEFIGRCPQCRAGASPSSR